MHQQTQLATGQPSNQAAEIQGIPSLVTFASLSDVSRRWQTDRSTTHAALAAAGVALSEFHRAPRYRWSDILALAEGWSEAAIKTIDPMTRLFRSEEIADMLNVTPQTVRNYGKSGRLYEVRLGVKTLRYALAPHFQSGSEAKADGFGKE